MLVARGRPSSEFPSIYVGDFTELYMDPSLHSFPSGHAADVWTGATILFVVAKQISVKFSLIVVAILVSLSRVALGAHYPIDILVGSLIGVLIGSLCLIVSRDPSNKI
jgi:Membrane-associated phospholipid phosphatase